ncbi:MAG: cyclic nucleotide-binding domain-containing protein [Deltaproteobacteria bacterium]|nr:cyclic nucleotide-binding domain-containing protein [Deltaproteobacteria bacterium]
MSNELLLEQADAAYAAGNLETALRAYAGLIEKDDENVYAWYRTAVALSRLGDAESAAPSIEEAALALAEGGQLPLALAALKDLERVDPQASLRAATRVAELYGVGSTRVARRGPPPPRSVVSAGRAMVGDLRVVREMAADRCEDLRALYSSKDGEPEHLPYHPLLSDLKPDDLASLVPLMELRIYGAGESVVEQGEEGTSLFIVSRGVAAVKRDDVHLAYLRSGAFFGEMALLTRQPRSASVAAHEPLALIEMGRDALEDLARRKPEVAAVLADYTRQRLVRSLMATSPLFQPLDPPRREALLEMFESRVYESGQLVLSEGDVAEGLYVVLSGAVRVTKQEGGESLALAVLEAGEVFGEISLIQRREATATVSADVKTVVLFLPRDAFNAHVGQFPEVLVHVFKLATEREQENSELMRVEPLALDDVENLLI